MGVPVSSKTSSAADEPAGVVGVQASGGGWVDRGELRVKLLAGEGLQAVAEGRVAGRAVEEALEERLEVERRAAGGDHRHVAMVTVGNDRVGPIDEAGDGERLVRVGHVDQMMADDRLLGGGGLGGADAHSPVDLHRIDTEDLGVTLLCDRHRHCRLARRGRAQDHQQRPRNCQLGTPCQSCSKLRNGPGKLPSSKWPNFMNLHAVGLTSDLALALIIPPRRTWECPAENNL